MLRWIVWPLRFLAARFGGWVYVLLLGLLISITIGGSLWEWERSERKITRAIREVRQARRTREQPAPLP